VSYNNGKNFQSLEDSNLNSDNIQSLIRDAIHPRPTVHVHHERWANAPAPFRNKRFVIVQIGPNQKSAFRFAKDYVEPKTTYCFRKHQVWVRNQATSDIATPEQIYQLLSKRSIPVPQPDFENTDYRKIPRGEQRQKVRVDLMQVLQDLGAQSHAVPPASFKGFKEKLSIQTISAQSSRSPQGLLC